MFAFHTMSQSIDYIENNLSEKLEMKDIAAVASYSTFHYQRLFQMLTGYTLGEYIRNRRMTLAAQDLLTSDMKVIDVALKYQYESPEAFTRAFKRIFDVSPSVARKGNVSLKSYPKLSVQVQLIGKEPLDYKIIDKESFVLEGYKKSFTAEEIMKGKAYGDFSRAMHSKVVKLMKKNKTSCKICAGSYRKSDQRFYDAIVGTYLNGDAKEEILEIQATKWCIFTGKGPVSETFVDLWQRIFLEWFPKTSFQHSGLTELEIFPEGDVTSPDYRYEIWIPLKGVSYENRC